MQPDFERVEDDADNLWRRVDSEEETVRHRVEAIASLGPIRSTRAIATPGTRIRAASSTGG